MKVTVCDKCKKAFEGEFSTEFIDPAYKIDICKSCIELFLNWIKEPLIPKQTTTT